ncbi:MAG: ribosome small subunit-dependent GTPase A [Bacteroidetes bacterium GWE2_39_28]|nr:MAG: ribosome small subunit-dependent GTPase A [Bacteroidetes bacterium GWE2_39_28]OFY13632.1 MAG: ribosome small subunit-dependent GTPase A [Bacteroidetes bacterium GWF2_39_10]OFZ07194.1 MAG: ribosome small subunit-dependent GTPase A [Bacteroidetes bacterium RIFOXYB2_FULL_39_7]OFZ11769.1 MAG: ribosome small subunit-dependent GTPase A [Bacteroidetes bacterium RIFOXYC2_FULL_39_11]HCT94831.1 ribosome small subunit-dependent GTPase A [Rikenellaceae bacterium]
MRKTEEGTVVKHTGSQYLVSKLPHWNVVTCVLKGKLRLKDSHTTNPVAVGDRVVYETEDGVTGVIKEVYPRRNYIIRKSTNLSRQAHIIASNLDQVFLIVTLDFPKTKLEFIDRFLVTCEAYKVPVKILLNKADLYTDEFEAETERFYEIYGKSVGYEIIQTSGLTGLNLNEVRERCKDKLTLFSGVSGVGKSSLINALDPDLALKTGDISDYHKMGKHTTTFYEIHPLESGGFIIDTPGIKGFGLLEMKPEELSHYFPEMLRILEKCRFTPCTHTHEPGCAVKAAVETGEILEERYYSYLSMLEDEEKYR